MNRYRHERAPDMSGKDSGAVLPLVAVLLTIIVVCVALAVDMGHVHSVKVQLQRAVDAAALAGSRELDGKSDESTRAVSAAKQVIAANTVDKVYGSDSGGTGWANDTNITVELGDWEENAFDKSPGERFTPGTPAPDAIKVSASLNVDPFFNVFGDTISVRADAIADNISKPITLPLAVVSCVPTGLDEVLSPGESLCDFTLMTFANANTDNSGWTSLTITPASGISPTYFTNAEPAKTFHAIELFNRIVYGTENRRGLETAPVKLGGCSFADNETHISQIDPVTLTGENEISCGLGESPSSNPSDDPLIWESLPRWYETEKIVDIATQKGLLSQGDESGVEYNERLKDLYKASDPNPDDGYTFADYIAKYGPLPVGIVQDDRFTRFISVSNNKAEANFWMPIKESGYPVVEVTNGVTNIIDSLRELAVGSKGEGNTSFKKSLSYMYPPLDGSPDSHAKGNSVLLTLPVIWSRNCDNKFTEGYYVGMANFLLTRLWETTNMCYDHGEDSITAQSFDNETTCADRVAGYKGLFGPQKHQYILPSMDGSGQLRNTGGFETKSMEGILLDPTKYPGEEIIKGVQRLVIVE